MALFPQHARDLISATERIMGSLPASSRNTLAISSSF
jgi:hypothetical protein